MGWTSACFHCWGTWLVARELLNSRVRAGACSLATAWRRRHGTPSGPAAFLGFRLASNLYAPFSLTVISGMSGLVLSSSVGRSSRSSLVKTLLNWSLRMSALVLLSLKSESAPLEVGYSGCVASLAFGYSAEVVCCVFDNDVFHESLLRLSVYLSGAVCVNCG